MFRSSLSVGLLGPGFYRCGSSGCFLLRWTLRRLAASHLLAGKYFQLAAFVMLVYDHILTFSQEVERIWQRRFSFATLLFLINRYCTLMQFIIVLTAFHERKWTGEPCRRFVLFEGMTTVGLIAVGQLVMILRVYAIYNRSSRTLVLLLVLWAVQIIMSAYGLRTGYPAPLPKGLAGCILSGQGPLFPFVWISPLVTDTVIFSLTIYRTKHYLHHLISPSMSESVARALMILVRDGTMYFFFIFLANLMNTLIFFFAPTDVKEIAASFSQLLTSTMLSRLVLNLRSLSIVKDMTTTVSADLVFRNPALQGSHGRSQQQHGAMGRKETSLWGKALNSLADESLGSISTGGKEMVDIHGDDVPLQRMGITSVCQAIRS